MTTTAWLLFGAGWLICLTLVMFGDPERR